MTTPQQSDSQEISTSDLIDFFKSAIAGKSAVSAASYSKAVSALEEFVAYGDPGLSISSPLFLEAWLVAMFFRGLTAKTAVYYLDLISALYGEAAAILHLPSTPSFSDVKARLKRVISDVWQSAVDETHLGRFVNFLRSTLRGDADAKGNILKDILMASMLSGGTDPKKIALARRGDIDEANPEIEEIYRRHADLKRKYIFPLDQTKYTPKQFRIKLEGEFADLFRSRMLRSFGDIHTTVRTYWALFALKNGSRAQDVATIAGPLPSTLPILSLLTPHSSLLIPNPSLLTSHSSLLTPNPERWYAMRMRRGVRFPKLEKRLAELEAHLPSPYIFYPYEEITKRIGKRIKYRRKPVIHDIVFFRYRATDIPELFRRIGDLAWCYRTAGTYAVIPRESMQAFQQTVGMFTPDYEVGEGGSLELAPDDEVVVVGGIFSGLEGKVVETMKTKKGVLYRLRLFGDTNDIEWRLADPKFLRRHPTSAGLKNKPENTI